MKRAVKIFSAISTVFNFVIMTLTGAGSLRYFSLWKQYDTISGYVFDSEINPARNNVPEGFLEGADLIVGSIFAVAGILIYVIIFLVILFIIYNAIPAIMGLCTLIKSRKLRNNEETTLLFTKAFRRDGIIKAVINGFPCFILLIFVAIFINLLNLSFLLLLLVYIGIVAISICQIVFCNKLQKSLPQVINAVDITVIPEEQNNT